MALPVCGKIIKRHIEESRNDSFTLPMPPLPQPQAAQHRKRYHQLGENIGKAPRAL
jgi:hypothetical protein